MNVNASGYGVGAGYSVSYNASAGYVQGNVSPGSNGNGPAFDGSWAYGDTTTPTNAPSQCDYTSDAVEAGIAYRTPRSDSEYYLYFSPLVYYQKNT